VQSEFLPYLHAHREQFGGAAHPSSRASPDGRCPHIDYVARFDGHIDQGSWLFIKAAISVVNIGIPSLVDEVPTHSPPIPPFARTLPSTRHAAKYCNQGRLAGIDKGVHRNRERGIPSAFKKGGARLVRRQFNLGEYYE